MYEETHEERILRRSAEVSDYFERRNRNYFRLATACAIIATLASIAAIYFAR